MAVERKGFPIRGTCGCGEKKKKCRIAKVE